LDGTYILSSSGTTLTLTSNTGQVDTATLSAVAVGATNSYYFMDFGITVSVTNSSAATVDTATQATAMLTKTITQTGSAAEEYDFMSGPTYSALTTFNTIDTLTYGTQSNSKMTNVGTTLIQGGALYNAQSAYNAGTAVAVDTWDTAFMNLSNYVDSAVDWISDKRSVFGAQINRINHVSSNLTTYTTNLQSTRSAIIDTDFAAETAKLTKGQIMQQAATAMLAQANQMPNVILSLLK
jgi:flagellin